MIFKIKIKHIVNHNKTVATAQKNKEWSFPLKISSVNVTKSSIICGFGPFAEEIVSGKLHFLCSQLLFWKHWKVCKSHPW